MSNRYYRKNNNELKNFNKLDQTVDELKNIILGKINDIQQKIKFLNNNIKLKNILKFELEKNIYIYFDKESNNTFEIILCNLTNLRKNDIIEINFNMLNKIKFHAGNQVELYINYKFINNRNILVCEFDIDKNIYRNKIVNNYVLFNIDKDYENIDLKINFYLDNTNLTENDFVEIFYYKEKYSELIIKHYSK